MKIIVISVFLSLFCSACITIGKPFPVQEVPTIVINQTTSRDLLDVFGQPYRTGMDDGDETWTYVHYKLRMAGEQQTRDLYVRFNTNGTVKSYSFNSSFDEDRNVLRRKNTTP